MGLEFAFDADLDDNGILLYRFSGMFDIAKWVPMNRAAVARIFPQGYDARHPIVCDIRTMKAAQGDWIASADEVFTQTEEVGTDVAPCALVIGNLPDAQMAARFFVEYRAAAQKSKADIRIFEDYDEGYAWALTKRGA